MARPTLAVDFEAERRIRDRVVRVWSIDRPWEAPRVDVIPDDHAGEVLAARGIPYGDYLVELAIDDGWTTPIRPMRNAPNVHLYRVGTATQMNERLEALLVRRSVARARVWPRTGRIRRHLDDDELRRISREALLTALEQLRALPSGAIPGTTFWAVGSLLLADLCTLVESCVDSYESADVDMAGLLGLAVAMGERFRVARTTAIPENLMRALWEVAPALAVAVDRSAVASAEWSQTLSTPEDRAREFLGWTFTEGLAMIEAGEGIGQVWIGMPAEQLSAIQRSIDLVPKQILSRDAMVAANFEWLMAAKTRPNLKIERWWSEHRYSASPATSTPEIARHLTARVPPNGTAAWAGVPTATLGAAITLVTNGDDLLNAKRTLSSAAEFARGW